MIKKEKNKNNEGSVFQRTDGRWCGMISIGFNEQGKLQRKSIYGKTKQEVLDKMKELTKRAPNLEVKSFKDSVSELIKEWLLTFKKDEVSSRTFERIISDFRLHIEPYTNKMTMIEVNKMTIKKIINHITDTVSVNTAKKVKTIFTQFFDYAEDERLIEYNPATNIKIKAKQKIDINILDESRSYKAIPPEDRQKFLDALEDNLFMKTLCYIGLYNGLRIGEILALRWQDIDFINKTINIRHGITIEAKFDQDGEIIERKTIVSTPKTSASIALLPITDVLYNVLLEWYQHQKDIEKKNKTILTSDDCFILCDKDSKNRTYHGTKTMYYRFLNKHKLNTKEFHFHALRHTFATMLKEKEQNLFFIKNLMRHTTTRTTEKYISQDKKEILQVQDKLNKLFK